MSRTMESVDAIKAAAQAWYERALGRAAAAHDARWPEHREWVESYLQEELRLRLEDRGWHFNG